MARWFLLLLPYVLLSHAQADISLQDREFFESRIRPILAQECYECHRTGSKQKGGLALDHRAALLEGGDGGPAITPGNPGASLLIQAMRHEHEDLKMPKAGAKLEPEVIADFVAWVKKGAPDPRDAPPSDEAVAADTQWDAVLERRKRWWSFLPLENPALPGEASDAHPIDRFVDERLHDEGLAKAPQADPATLIRRLSFVLRGLPPSPEEIDRFVADDSEGAYARLVDQFLDSRQFGERWARHWMDWVRYADSHGSEGDPMIPYAWRYRDYLIRALNEDVPYDQLVKEHLAGDLLQNPRINAERGLNESAIGPAHLRMVFHGFAPTDALGEQVRFVDDQINVVSKAFMGLTVSCARCHDHKFDAISQRDFYAWYGIFASCPPASISASAPTERETNARKILPGLKKEIRAALADAWTARLLALPERLKTLEEAIGKAESPNHLLHPLWLARSGKPVNEALQVWRKLPQESLAEPDWNITKGAGFQSWVIEGQELIQKADAGEFSVSAKEDQLLAGIYPRGRYSHLLSSKDRGVLLSPRVLLNDERDLWMLIAGDGGAVARYAVQNYPRNGTVYPTKNLSGGQWRWEHFSLDYWKGDHVHVEFTTAADQPVLAKTNADRSWVGIRRVAMFPKGRKPFRDEFAFGRPLLDALAKQPGNLVGAYRAALEQAIAAWRKNQTSDDQSLFLDQAIRVGLLSNSPEQLPEVAALAERYREMEEHLPVPVRVPGVLEGEPFDQALMVRGDHKQPAEPVARTFLDAIDSTPYGGKGSGRLELAHDLFRNDNPLSRRVSVNRFWHHAFGEGLVRTPDNLGRLGQKPSHPKLLDHLAVWFEANEYSIKGLLRYLVTSEVWKASSAVSNEARAKDPDNRLLSHAHLRRLDAEAIRDALLAVSGQLEEGSEGASSDR